MTKETTMTPFMKQFNELKAKHPEAILLFRIGDFYEAYDEDATKIGEILGITVTRKFNSKDKGSDGHALKLAGFPYHALDTYLPKIIRAGLRVAICDQLDSKVTKEYPSDENEAKPETLEPSFMKLAKLSENDFKTLSLISSIYNRLCTNPSDEHNNVVRAVTIDFLTKDHYPEDLDIELANKTLNMVIDNFVDVEVSLLRSFLTRFWYSRCGIK